MSSETAKWRHITAQFCTGMGLDLGSAGDPVVPHAIQVELPQSYSVDFGGGKFPIHLRGDAADLYWFRSNSLDFVYSSHLLEDFADWMPCLEEWTRVLKVGGHLVILMPEIGRWKEALRRGQPPNLAHKHEARIGELTEHVNRIGGFHVIMDQFCDDKDYGMVFVAQKVQPTAPKMG